MFIVGLTGGIGSGKSTAEEIFASLGVTTVNADDIAHALTEPGEPVYEAMIAHFGSQILNEQGRIDRCKLRDYIFNHDHERLWLQQRLHPLVREKMIAIAEESKTLYTILSIPLLTESGSFDDINRILVIDAPESLQITRSTARDQTTAEQIAKIMQVQNSRIERLKYADDVIVNDSTLDDLRNKITQLHTDYVKLALENT